MPLEAKLEMASKMASETIPSGCLEAKEGKELIGIV